MNEFENKLIVKEEVYQRNFFPKVPNFRKNGSAFILTEGSSDDIVVNEHTTTKEIRQGKYTKLVEISTRPYVKEISFHSPSKENAYSFDVYVKAVIQVIDPILFYQNKNIDVDAYFDNLFSLDVRKITKTYSILDYNGMDEELTKKLSSYSTVDEATGFNYRISVVDATPGEKAQEYVFQYSKQQLDAKLKDNARELKDSYINDYKNAIMTEVAEGKLSETEAILKINEYENLNFENGLKRYEELRDKGMITDKEARHFMVSQIENTETIKKTEKPIDNSNSNNKKMDNFYDEDEK